MAPTGRLVAPGTTRPVIALRALVVALPCIALALAIPEVPHWFVLVTVPLSASVWARTPDHAVGIVPLVLVAGWWAAHGVVDWRVLVVAVLLLGAHVSAVLLSYGPGTLPVDPRLVRLWLRRGLLALVPAPVAWLALRGIDPALAPSWLWLATASLTAVVLLATARLTRSESAR
jgi:hypothetical protein